MIYPIQQTELRDGIMGSTEALDSVMQMFGIFSCLLNEHATMHLRIGQAAAGVPASQPSRVYRH